MAKPKARTLRRKVKAKKKNNGNGKQVARMTRGDENNQRAYAFMRALMDPCNAPLEPGVYPGAIGIVQRFSQQYVVTLTAAQTAFLLTLTPGAGISYQVQAADAATGIVVSYLSTFVPGASYITANMRSMRCLGACFEFFTNAAPNNAQGTFNYGVHPHSVVANGLATIGGILPNLQMTSKVSADAYEVKWKPGIIDEQYKQPSTNLTGNEWDDVNSITVVGTGFPVSSSITVKITTIVEWLPATNLGIATPAAVNGAGVRANQVVAALDKQHPTWFGGKVGEAAKFVWNHGGSTIAKTAVRTLATKVAPFLLL